MMMCRDLTLDDVKDIDVSMKCSALDVLAAVAVRAKEILEQHHLANTVKRTHDVGGKADAGGKEILAKRVLKRSYDGGEASPSTSPPEKKIIKIKFNFRPTLPEKSDKLIEENLPKKRIKVVKGTHDGEASTSTSASTSAPLPPSAAVSGKKILIEKRSAKRSSHDGEATSPPKKRTKCNSKNLDEFRPPLPERVDKLIREMARGRNLTPPTLVIQKRLFETDLTKGHNRLSIPIRLIRDDFLTEEEKRHVLGRDVNGKKNFIQATMIEPSLATDTVDFRQWDMAKGNGGRTSSLYIINGSWYDLAMRNELQVKMEVQLWCFRIDRDLCFALVRPPMQRLSF